MQDDPIVDVRTSESPTTLSGLGVGLLLSLALWCLLAIAWTLVHG